MCIPVCCTQRHHIPYKKTNTGPSWRSGEEHPARARPIPAAAAGTALPGRRRHRRPTAPRGTLEAPSIARTGRFCPRPLLQGDLPWSERAQLQARALMPGVRRFHYLDSKLEPS